MIALLFLGAALATLPPAPHWGGLNADAANALKAEGIREEMYEHLAAGDVLTEQRPVPAGKTGVHLASFGIVRGPAAGSGTPSQIAGECPNLCRT